MAKTKKYDDKNKNVNSYSQEVSDQAINIVSQEIKTWEDATVFITEKVAFRIRDLIRTCYKNYWGVFDKPKDPLTDREKIWYPLSEEVANSWADNSDLDLKDIQYRTRPGGTYAMTQITRQLMTDYLDQTGFSQDLDDGAFEKGITGTSVTKVINQKVNGKNKISRHLVNLLNFYIDPTAKSIQEAYRVTERALMFPDEMRGMTGWLNTAGLEGELGLPNFDPGANNMANTSTVKTRDVYEMWGKIPKSMLYGKKAEGEIDGHIIVSGLDSKNPKCHLIEENINTDKEGNIIKPYEEDWAMRVPGRWYGRGPVEQVMMLQLWINTIINIRVNRSYVSQLGLWKIKRGANITPATIQKLGSNGAVLVSSMDDIEQMVMQDASQASYTDENNIRDIAKRITRTLEAITGEPVAASTSATASSIQASSSKTPFIKIKQRAGFFVDRLINRHLMAKVAENSKKGDILRILQTDGNIDEILERIAFHYVDQYQDEQALIGLYLTPQQLEIAIQSAKEQLRQRPEIFIESLENVLAEMVDCTTVIMNEELDMGSMADKMVMAANLLPEEDRGAMAESIYDIMGVPFPAALRIKQKQAQTMQPQMPGQVQGPGAVPFPTGQM